MSGTTFDHCIARMNPWDFWARDGSRLDLPEEDRPLAAVQPELVPAETRERIKNALEKAAIELRDAECGRPS